MQYQDSYTELRVGTYMDDQDPDMFINRNLNWILDPDLLMNWNLK